MTSIDDRPDRVCDIAEEGFQDAIEIRQIISVLETQNNSGANLSLSDGGAGRAALVVRNGLLSRLVVLVARGYAPTREGDLHLQMAFDLLKVPEVRKEIEERGSAESIAAAIQDWNKLRGDHRRERIEHFRDKYTAHLGAPKDIPLPQFKELFGFARTTSAVMSMLAIATGVRTEAIDAWDETIVDSAHNFWKPWTAKKTL